MGLGKKNGEPHSHVLIPAKCASIVRVCIKSNKADPIPCDDVRDSKNAQEVLKADGSISPFAETQSQPASQIHFCGCARVEVCATRSSSWYTRLKMPSLGNVFFFFFLKKRKPVQTGKKISLQGNSSQPFIPLMHVVCRPIYTRTHTHIHARTHAHRKRASSTIVQALSGETRQGWF